jgi:hypothetical protein
MDNCCPFLIIFRGDDTDHELNKSIRFVMTDSGYNLDGMTLHFSFLGIDKTFTDFDPERSCELVFTSEETKQFPVGINYATLYLIDAKGKKHTLTNTLPVKVTLNAEEAYNGLDIPVRFPMFNIGTCNINELRSDVDRLIDAYNKALDGIQDNKMAIENVAHTFSDIISHKQDALNDGQMAAVNSGIDSEWVSEQMRQTQELQQDSTYQAGLIDRKIPLYTSVGATEVDGDLYLHPFSCNEVSNTLDAMTIASVERKSSDGSLSFASDIVLDCFLVIDCRGRETAPTITWGAIFHPRTDAETDFACVAGVRNVYWITEHSPNEFCVAGWQETDGGGTSNGGAA